MKKVLMLICAFLLSGVFLVSSAKAGPSVDQQYIGGTGSISIFSDLGRFAQSFKPTMSGLSKVEIELANVSPGQTMSVAIRHRLNVTWDVGSVATVSNQTVVNGWNTFDFVDIDVLTGADDYYGIWTTCPDNGPQWKYTSGPSTYAYGYATWQSTDKPDWDYNFKTWGTNPVEIVDENTQANANTNTNSTVIPAGQSAGTGDAPATTTSAAIKAPSGLTALFSSGAANLAWTKSTTTDIDGYKIFRSESETKNFTEIGKTVKTVSEYVDTKDLVAGKTFYYFVRAYKTTAQSASTATVSLLIPESAAVTNTNTNKSILPIITSILDDTDYNQIALWWILGGVIAVLIVLLAAYEYEKKKKGGFPGAKHFRLIK